MPRNGSGQYSLPSGNPVVTNTVISSSGWANPTLTDVAAALTDSIAADGQTVPTANLPMGNFRHTGVANAQNRTDYAAAGQIQDGGLITLANVSGTDTITATTAPPITVYTAGQQFRFVAAGTNLTGIPTLNINAIGAKNLTRLGAQGLLPGDIQNGAVVTVTYDGTQFQVTGIVGSQGIVGAVRNGRMLVSAAGTTGTFTADEVILESALGGVPYKLSSFSQAVNLSTTGAGGMDTGAAPTSGYVGLYAIYNPVTGAAALLATNGGGGVLPSVYAAGNMPSGYTASALVGVWPTNASKQFPLGFQEDRKFFYASPVTVLSSTTVQGTIQTLSIQLAAPPNAREIVGGLSSFVGTAGALAVLGINGSANGIGAFSWGNCPGAAGAATSMQFRLPLTVAQNMFYTSAISGGTITYTISIIGYDF